MGYLEFPEYCMWNENNSIQLCRHVDFLNNLNNWVLNFEFFSCAQLLS